MSLTLNANTGQIIISRGDDGLIRYTVRNSSGVAYDVSANSFAFTVKRGIDDSILDAEFQKINPAASGIDLTLAASGIVDVNIADTDTSGMAGNYVYDLEMTEGGKIYTLAQGAFLVKKDVTTVGTAGQPSFGVILFPGGMFAIGSDGAIYFKDRTTGLWWTMYFDSGGMITNGPSASIPF